MSDRKITTAEYLERIRNLSVDDITSSLKWVWFDADGVLVDWERYVCRRLHLVDDRFSILPYVDPNKNITLLNSLDSTDRPNVMSAYYDRFPDTFSELEVMDDFFVFVDLIRVLMDKNIGCGVLTSIQGYTNHANYAISHKRMNLTKHLEAVNISLQIEIITTNAGKTSYADKDVLLIDDFNKNTKAFSEAGGLALTYKPNSINTVLSDLYDILAQ